MTVSAITPIDDIHAAILAREFDHRGFVRDYGAQIDDHVLTCEPCHKHMIGQTEHLPKLRAKMTVNVSPAEHLGGRMRQMEQMKLGECLPCGCVITSVAWTREQAVLAFRAALADSMNISVENAGRIPPWTQMLNLPLTIKDLRRLRDKFWLPDMSSLSPEVRDEEEGAVVRQLPQTIGGFIDQLLKIHSSYSWSECSEHWDPA